MWHEQQKTRREPVQGSGRVWRVQDLPGPSVPVKMFVSPPSDLGAWEGVQGAEHLSQDTI